MRQTMARRWADRIVRGHAAAALQLAGFTTAAGALSSAPELSDVASVDEARVRVEAALSTLLFAREVPSTEGALVATLAAKKAVAVAAQPEPSDEQLADVVAALHVMAR